MSPTAEQVWRRHPDFSVKSAGTSRNARKPLTITLFKIQIFTQANRKKR
ncbi:hypothetical protein LPW36_09900 [Jinshanibacter sp. LJY008]|uniref:Uncharacterized protein n=1 Tax=Limnobaculum eriocheiris TaxID=2897391 RepID=A0A9X1MXA7_9GAMM|nr:hypothetical protein [Limnobaculum eriocheiris]MCD1126308.1 hypothetical protein [Limnobaculum eriocheiris]